MPENNIGITVLTDFPAKEDLVFMQLDSGEAVSEGAPKETASPKS